MKPVDQTIVCPKRGNCMQAVAASFFELELEQVPHFILYNKDMWWRVYFYFYYAMGYLYVGVLSKPKAHELLEEYSINGYFSASVRSRNFEGSTHAVIMDANGVVVHDPSPNKKFQGVNVIDTGELESILKYQKQNIYSDQ